MDDLHQFGYVIKLIIIIIIIIMVTITIPQGRFSSKAFIYWRNFAKKWNLKIKNMKMKQFSRVSIAKSEGNFSKNCQISIFGFKCVSIDIEDWLKIPN
jgi:uncharacterized ion transporter superfamily protein YfcC